MNRTDLAAEAAQMLSDKSGIRSVSRKIGGIEITDVREPIMKANEIAAAKYEI